MFILIISILFACTHLSAGDYDTIDLSNAINSIPEKERKKFNIYLKIYLKITHLLIHYMAINPYLIVIHHYQISLYQNLQKYFP